MKSSRLGWGGLALLALELLSPLANAQTTERASARSIADQGFDAFDSGAWQVALDRFERAESLVHSPVHRLFIARCQANLGLLLEAKETYVAIAREPLAADAPTALLEARRAASTELSGLEVRVPLVLVSLAGERTGTEPEVQMDGKRVPAALIGVPYPVNPGPHTWQAWAGSSKSPLEARSIREGSRETVSLRLAAAPAVVTTPALRAAAPALPSAAPLATTSTRNAWPWGAIAGFGVGAVGTGVGVMFALKKSSLDEDIEQTCRRQDCPGTRENYQRQDDANSAGLVATVGFIAAGAGIATGITLLLLDSDAPADEGTTAGIDPWLGLGAAGVSGRF